MYFDLRKAFDIFHYNIIVISLLTSDFPLVRLGCFIAFLTNRQFSVSVVENLRTLCLVKCGVSEGLLCDPCHLTFRNLASYI